MENTIIMTTRHEFKLGEWVHVGGNRNTVAEVVDIKEEQIKVKMLTQPNMGKHIYTTRYTYYTIPISEEDAVHIAKQLGISTSRFTLNASMGESENSEELIEKNESIPVVETKEVEIPKEENHTLVDTDKDELDEKEDEKLVRNAEIQTPVMDDFSGDFQLSLF